MASMSCEVFQPGTFNWLLDIEGMDSVITIKKTKKGSMNYGKDC